VAFEEGQTFSLPVRSSDFENLLGFQLTFEYNDYMFDLLNVASGALELGANNIGLHPDKAAITMSWNDVQPQSFDEEEVLFTLELSAKRAGSVSSSMSLTDAITQSEAYDEAGNKNTLLSFRSVKEEYKEFALYQNSPNPFSNQTVVGFVLPTRADYSMLFYDVNGKELLVIEEEGKKGYNQVQLSSGDIKAQGVIYYKLESGEYSASKKMVVIK
jgi:hypothetical protein